MFRNLFNRIVPPSVRALVPSLGDVEFIGYLQTLGFNVESRDRTFRCHSCNFMQHSGTAIVWIPDGTLRGDPMWSVYEKKRRWAYNGSFSGWCVSCCRSFTPMTAEEMAKYSTTPHDPIPTFGGPL